MVLELSLYIIKVLSYFNRKVLTLNKSNIANNLTVIGKHEHGISNKHIPAHILKIIQKLKTGKFKAYLVGGCVRDIMLGLQPKDFDIATDARPAQIKALFKQAYIIGKRFKLVHIRCGKEIVEVSTFRGNVNNSLLHKLTKFTRKYKTNADGFLVKDNVYGNIEEDAIRRDLTINALYYDPDNCTVHDYANGAVDLQNKLLRIIGNPQERFKEDPVRIIRIIRFAVKLNFQVAEQTLQAMQEQAHLIVNTARARIYHEANKLFCTGYSYPIFKELIQHNLFNKVMFNVVLPDNVNQVDKLVIKTCLENTDNRVKNGKYVSLSFIYSALLWYQFKTQIVAKLDTNNIVFREFYKTTEQFVYNHPNNVGVPNFMKKKISTILKLQVTMQFNKEAVEKIVAYKDFRAAYDFLQCRTHSQEVNGKHVKFFSSYYE